MAKKVILHLFMAVFALHNHAACQSTQHDSVQAEESLGSASASKPKSQNIYHVGGDVKPPRMVESFQSQPDQKPNSGAKVKRIGSTMLRIVVGEDGTVQNATILESFDRDLDAKAIEAAKRWKFDPATKKGIRVPVELTVMIDFRLYK